MSVSDEDIEKMKAKIKSELEPFTNKIITIPQTDLVDFKRDYMKFLSLSRKLKYLLFLIF